MHDLISRQALCEYALNQKDKSVTPNDIMRFPSAQPDLSEYSDKLWRNAYERGKRDAQPEQRWIPCSERLPNNGRQVLVFARSVHFALAKYSEMREADGTYKKQWVTFDAWKPFYTIKEVIAWRELPEPYTERREE